MKADTHYVIAKRSHGLRLGAHCGSCLALGGLAVSNLAMSLVTNSQRPTDKNEVYHVPRRGIRCLTAQVVFHLSAIAEFVFGGGVICYVRALRGETKEALDGLREQPSEPP